MGMTFSRQLPEPQIIKELYPVSEEIKNIKSARDEEIKKVFKLAFNNINDRTDDILSWEDAYQGFCEIQEKSVKDFLSVPLLDEGKLEELIKGTNKIQNEKDAEAIRTFLIVMTLIARGSVIKSLVQKIVEDYYSTHE